MTPLPPPPPGDLTVPVTIKSATPVAPPFETTGYVPFPTSPLAVTPRLVWREIEQRWDGIGGWQITHRATGLNLGQRQWSTRAEAMAALERCDPHFAGWLYVEADRDALVACRVLFRGACSEGA